MSPCSRPCSPRPARCRRGRAGPTSSSGTGSGRWPSSRAGAPGCSRAAGPRSPRPTRSCRHLGEAFDDAIIDGEVVVLDAKGRPSFQDLAERMHVREKARAARLAAALPVTYLAFDVLRFDGVDLFDTPYERRRDIARGAVVRRAGRRAPGVRRRRRDRDGQPGEPARGRGRQAARLALPARPALTGLDQGQARRDGRVRGRRLAGRQAGARRAPGRGARPGDRRAALPRPGRRRHLGGGRAQAALPRSSR